MDEHANDGTQEIANESNSENTENMAENKANAEPSNPVQDDKTMQFTHTIEQAVQFFADQGFTVAPRTISHYCNKQTFHCKKFKDTAQHVKRWKVREESLHRHLEQLQKDAQANASNTQTTASIPSKEEKVNEQNTSNEMQTPSTQSHAIADQTERYIKTLEEQLKEKDLQIAKLQSQGEELAGIAKGLGFLLQSPKGKDDDREQQG